MQATNMGTYIGHRRGSPLYGGRTRTWRDYHGLSVASVALRLVADEHSGAPQDRDANAGAGWRRSRVRVRGDRRPRSSVLRRRPCCLLPRPTCLLLIIQLVSASLIVILLDEHLPNDCALGSDIQLFVLTYLCELIRKAPSLCTTDNTRCPVSRDVTFCAGLQVSVHVSSQYPAPPALSSMAHRHVFGQ